MRNALDFWRNDFLSPFKEFERMLGSAQEGQWRFNPSCDVEETDTHYVFSFDLPGISKDDIKIEVLDNQLTVSGERKYERKDENNRHLVERHYGSFQRSFMLPGDVKSDNIEASYENGVLTLGVPKAEAVKPRQIKIGEGKPGFLGKLLSKDEKKAS